MKVSIGSKIVQGPWGGGNLFAINLSNYLLSQGHSVIYDLTDPDIDLILLTDPRSRGESSSTFNHIDIEQYRKYINPRVAVIQRINECDERKNTNNINSFYMNASNVADHVVFVSTWLRNIYLQLGMSPKKSSVILAGANSEVFNPTNAQTYTKDSKVKLVTHHWSSHSNKGFDIYKKTLYQPYSIHVTRNSSEIISVISVKVQMIIVIVRDPGESNITPCRRSLYVF